MIREETLNAIRGLELRISEELAEMPKDAPGRRAARRAVTHLQNAHKSYDGALDEVMRG
jgi:hypothetical protein